MNASPDLPDFEAPRLYEQLAALSAAQLDALPYGVIGFDAESLVVRYNNHESSASAFTPEAVLGQHLFYELAPCLNNYLVEGRFAEALERREGLDETLPYVLTFRMRPTRARLRLLAMPGHALRFVLVDRQTGGLR